MAEAPNTFVFEGEDSAHRVGDPTCDKGWCDGVGTAAFPNNPGDYPWPHDECEADPPGLMHANFGGPATATTRSTRSVTVAGSRSHERPGGFRNDQRGT